jgi:hypothetical protein
MTETRAFSLIAAFMVVVVTAVVLVMTLWTSQANARPMMDPCQYEKCVTYPPTTRG